jgi:hypothetical protein
MSLNSILLEQETFQVDIRLITYKKKTCFFSDPSPFMLSWFSPIVMSVCDSDIYFEMVLVPLISKILIVLYNPEL